MIFWAVVAAVLLVSATAQEEERGDVAFWMEKVTLHCPMAGDWYKASGTEEKSFHYGKTHTYEYTGSKDQFYCKYSEQKYFFYIQGKVCANCIELDGSIFAYVLVGDAIGTVVLMAIVYKCTKKKATQHEVSHPNVQRPQGSDYETLNIHNRASEYSTVVNRMG